MTIPTCPEHGEMKLVEITQGDQLLGLVWWCLVKDCDECQDYEEVTQLPLPL